MRSIREGANKRKHLRSVLRFSRADTGDRQLVTWSKDQSLRLWKIDTHMQKVRTSFAVLCKIRQFPRSFLQISRVVSRQLCGHEATGDVSDANPLASIFVSPDHVTGDAGNTPEVKNSAAPTAMPPGAEQKNGENNNTCELHWFLRTKPKIGILVSRGCMKFEQNCRHASLAQITLRRTACCSLRSRR